MEILKPRADLPERRFRDEQWCDNARNRDRVELGRDIRGNVYIALSRNDWHRYRVDELGSQHRQGDPSIDDPVNDTGLGPQRGDLQVSAS